MTSSIPPRERAAARSSEAHPDFADGEELIDGPTQKTDRSEHPQSYREFMEKMGNKFMYAKPQGYLMGETPFPMNPSFKPPPPISDQQKEVIYQLYKSHRLENGPRRLAKRFNISHSRLNAILRLKIYEKEFEKKHTLQTGFQVGMEKLLGAITHSKVPAIKKTLAETDPTSPDFQAPDVHELRTDAQKADLLDQVEQRDVRASRYERMYWESVQEDGREPLLPSVLQTAKQQAEMRKLAKEVRESKRFLRRVPNTKDIRHPGARTLLVGRPSDRKGPITKFVDVGGAFMDITDRIRALGVTKNRVLRRRKLAEEKRRLADERIALRKA